MARRPAYVCAARCLEICSSGKGFRQERHLHPVRFQTWQQGAAHDPSSKVMLLPEEDPNVFDLHSMHQQGTVLLVPNLKPEGV